MPAPASAYRFGPFELHPRTRELYKNGIKLKLRPQPCRVLQVLVERSGDVVTREELRSLLWPAETFVDFEQGLNTSIKELRGVLCDSASDPRYVETLPKLGYRITVPVETHEPKPAAPSSPGSPLPSHDLTTPETLSARPPVVHAPFLWRITLGTAAILVVLALSLGAYWRWFRSRPDALAAHRITLAVLPFANLTGDSTQDYFSDGLTEEMISQLGRIDPQRMGVIARTSVMTYKSQPKPLDQIGRELGVAYVLEGSVRRDAGKVRVAAQLIQTRDQTHIWARQYDRELSDLLALQAEIAQEIAGEIQLAIGNKHAPSPSLHAVVTPASYEAYDLYLRGRYFWNKRTESGFRQAAGYFQQAIDKDPNYAPAYAGLADTYALMSTWSQVPAREFMPKARATALRAVAIDDSLAEAHTSLALIAEQYDYDWQTAEKEFRRAIQLDPDYATAHHWYAECLGFQGRFDEAFVESERARQLDPLSLIIATDHAWLLFYSRQYDRAIEELRAIRAMEPDSPRSDAIVGVYVEAGRFAEALAEVEDSTRRNHLESAPGTFAVESYVYSRWGRREESQRMSAKFTEELARHPLSEDEATWMLLHAYMGAGRKDDVIALLHRRYAAHSNELTDLKVSAFYDPLRGDPRFQELLRLTHLAD